MDTAFDEDSRIAQFRYSHEQFQKEIVKKMCECDTLPADVFKKSENKRIRRFYFPMRVFEGSYEGRWTAQEGVDEERLVVRRDERGFFTRAAQEVVSLGYVSGYKQPPQLTSEVQTNWHHISGTHEGGFSLIGIANDAQGGIASKIKKLFRSYSLDYLQKLDMYGGLEAIPSDVEVLQPTQREEQTWTRSISAQVDDVAARDLKRQFSGMKIRNLSLSLSKSRTSYLVYIPVWVFEFVYNDKEYCLSMDEGRMKLEGELPSADLLTKEVRDKKEAQDDASGSGCLLWLSIPAIFGGVIYSVQLHKFEGFIAAGISFIFSVWLIHSYRKGNRKAKQLSLQIADRAKERVSESQYLFGVSAVSNPPVKENDIEDGFNETSRKDICSVSTKHRATYVFLAIFLGILGVHNFYAGYYGRAIFQLLITMCSFLFLSPIVWLWAIIEACVVKKTAKGNPFS